MMHIQSNQPCRNCGDDIDLRRWAIGFKFCMPCGEALARQVKHTIAPMHKSNYLLVSNPEDLKGLNNKGGLYR
jgi:ribosomal protein L37AE/L43A